MRRVAVAFVCCLCSCADAAVSSFEDFYAATAAQDAATVRSFLCPDARATVDQVSNEELKKALHVRRVVRQVTLQGTQGNQATLAVQDATGQTTFVILRKDDAAPRGWCVAEGLE